MHAIDYAIIVAYLGGMVAVGLLMARRASAGIEAYFLGGRKLPWWMLGTSGMASNLDVTGTMINAALIFALGLSGFLIEIRGGVVLVMAFLMVCMGKWNRRSGVMTFAEWMRFRFGGGRPGDAARLFAAIGSLITTTAMVTYFCTGAGKFVAEVIGMPDLLGIEAKFWGALAMISIALVYTVSSGFYGVIVTDLFQSGLIFIAIVAVSAMALIWYPLPEAFSVAIPMKDGTFGTLETTAGAWSRILPTWQLGLPAESSYAIYDLIGVAVVFYLFKVTVEGFSGSNGYMAQRYFAAKSDREAGLLSLLWTALLSFRWPFTVAIALMGISYVASGQGTIADPERVLPIVIVEMIPAGLKGLLLAGLIAAAMSTFDSTVNAGASFWVKDIYQAYLRPEASERQLVRQSRIGTLAIVLGGLLLSLSIRNINDIWGWITMSIGVGLLVPMVVRWYWWRMNGWGFAGGTIAGMTGAVLQKLFFGHWTEYAAFSSVAALALVGIVVGTLATAPTDPAVLREFYRRTRPFGLWGPVRREVEPALLARADAENRRDLFALLLAVPWQLALFATWMMVVLRAWVPAAVAGGLTAALSVGLYFAWYRHLGRDGEDEASAQLDGDQLEGAEVEGDRAVVHV